MNNITGAGALGELLFLMLNFQVQVHVISVVVT